MPKYAQSMAMLTVSKSLKSFDSGHRSVPWDGSPDKLPVRAYGESAEKDLLMMNFRPNTAHQLLQAGVLLKKVLE
jgi:hypothetical protein